MKDQYSSYHDATYFVIGNKQIKAETSFFTDSFEVFVNGSSSLLLVFIPLSILSSILKISDTATFILALLGLAPLAEKLGFITEQLAIHTNQTIGGLLNATIGNAIEFILAIFALKRKMYRLVQLSMLGSILTNILLTLGICFLFGGIRYKKQNFSKISSHLNATLLILSLMAILFPTVLTLSKEESILGELGFSRVTSIILFIVYFAFLYFQVRFY